MPTLLSITQVFPTVKHVLDKFRHKLPKEELKRLGKEIAKKLVASDYKNNRVEDPTAQLGERQTLKIKKYVKDFLVRAVEKYNEHQKQQGHAQPGNPPASSGDGTSKVDEANGGGESRTPKEADVEGDVALSDLDDNGESPSSLERKRKRAEEADSAAATPSEDAPDAKRIRGDEDAQGTPPPPPPPPPDSAMTEEQKAFQEQEEALMRENEEAQRLDDEANKTKDMEEKADKMRKDIALTA